MKKIFLLSLLILGLVFVTTPVMADSLVVDFDPPNEFSYSKWGPFSPDTNPMYFSPTPPSLEGAWLNALLGFNVPFIIKYKGDTAPYGAPATWTYAVLKYGVGRPGIANPNHWAIMDDGDFILELAGIGGLPERGLSHVSYFGPTNGNGSTPVPEPTTMILLGSGLLGLAIFGRKLRKK